MGSSETWIDIGCYGFPCLLWASRPRKLCSACYGQESVLSWVIHLPLYFVTRVWALCGSSCPALVKQFPGRVLTCCSFTELRHFVAVAHPLEQEFTSPPEFAANMFRDPELRHLAQALPYILVHHRAASTVSTYLGAYKSWKAWELRQYASVLPADSVTFDLYVVSLTQEARSMSAVNSAVYGVNYVHKKSGYPEVSEHPVAKQLLDAAKRILARPLTRMKPMSIDKVWSLLTNLLQRSFTKFFNRHGLIVVKYGATLREMRFAIQA